VIRSRGSGENNALPVSRTGRAQKHDGGRRMGRRRADQHNSTEHLFLERESLMLRFPLWEVN
jgi:hypothetical protein